jgi:hypothetical protein
VKEGHEGKGTLRLRVETEMYHASHEVGRVPIDARVAWAGGACSAGANWCESEGFVPSSQLEIWNLYPLLQINHVW